MKHLRLIVRNTVAHGLNIAVGLAFAIAGARLLPVGEYGDLRYAMTLLPLFMAFSLPGYDSIILRSASLRRRVPLLEIFYVRAGGALLGTMLMIGGVILFRESINPVLRFFLLSIAVLLPFFETGTGYRNYLIGVHLREAGLTRVILARLMSLLMIGVFFLLIYACDLPRRYLLPAYLLAMILPTLIMFFAIALRQHKMPRRLAQLQMPGALAATLAGLVYTLAFSLDKLMVRQQLGAAELALYGILVMTPQELSKLFDATVPLFYRTLFYSRQAFDLRRTYKAWLALLPLSAAYVICFHALSAFVFGAAYHYAWWPVIVSGILIASQSFEYLNTHRIFAISGSQALFRYSLFSLTMAMPLLAVGLFLGGMEGLMLGLIVKQVLAPLAFLRWAVRPSASPQSP
ncbi:MAG: hypothetical protein KGJ06_00665 [Pseudomonadota bacterium]|nr:hypothetical protein [Pseudomonadota bacterium]